MPKSSGKKKVLVHATMRDKLQIGSRLSGAKCWPRRAGLLEEPESDAQVAAAQMGAEEPWEVEDLPFPFLARQKGPPWLKRYWPPVLPALHFCSDSYWECLSVVPDAGCHSLVPKINLMIDLSNFSPFSLPARALILLTLSCITNLAF